MEPVASILIPCCAVNKAPLLHKEKDIFSRIKNCFNSICKGIHEQRYFILTISTTFAAAVLTTETLAFLPLAIYAIFLGLYMHFSHWNDTTRAAQAAKKLELEEERKRLLLEINLTQRHVDAFQNFLIALGDYDTPEIRQMRETLQQQREQLRILNARLQRNPNA